jgi:membrane associated rhomboid family serine protease
MAEDRLSTTAEHTALTPWVARLMVVNAVVLLLLETVFTAPIFSEALEYLPGSSVRHPWTFLSYMFTHGGVVQLGVTTLLLFAFGPPLERRMGSRSFVLFYLYCGVGAALFTLGLSSLMDVSPLKGATGALLGIGLAFAFAWPDAELDFPLPGQITARTLVLSLAATDLLLSFWLDGGLVHPGYLGGMAAAYLFLRIQGVTNRRDRQARKVVTRRPVMAPMPVRQGSPAVDLRPVVARPEPVESVEQFSPEALDRVLDKISATGIESLTAEERRFLDEMAKRKRKDLH